MSSADMIMPIVRLKAAVKKAVASNSEIREDEFDFKFFMDPFKEIDLVETDYATYEEYNHLMDPYMPLGDRRYLWQMFRLQRTIDTVAKLEMAFMRDTKKPAEGEESWDETAMN